MKKPEMELYPTAKKEMKIKTFYVNLKVQGSTVRSQIRMFENAV